MEEKESTYDIVDPTTPATGIKIPGWTPGHNCNTNGPQYSTYKTLEAQNPPSKYAISQRVKNAVSKDGGQKRKKVCAKRAILCNFVLLSTILSMAALAVAVVSILMVTRQMVECKGQVASLMEQFCDNIDGNQNGDMPCVAVDNVNDTNCTFIAINMKACL